MKPLIVAIDPGVADPTAICWLRGGRVEHVESVSGEKGFGPQSKIDYATAADILHTRALTIWGHVGVYDDEPDHVVIESYVDQGKGRRFGGAWYTPFLLGELNATSHESGFSDLVVWQHSQDVLSDKALGWMKGKTRFQIPGGELLRSEHLGAAAAHAMYFEDRLRFAALTGAAL